MNRFYLLIAFILLFNACSKDPIKGPVETEDWIKITSPVDGNVYGVYGNIDHTLIISTGYRVYYTQNQGRSWQKADFPPTAWAFGFTMKGDTLYSLSGRGPGSASPGVYASSPDYFSVDHGKTWKDQRTTIPPYGMLREAYRAIQTPQNRWKTSGGISYEIEELKTPMCPACTTIHYLQTPGLQTSDGRKIRLPQEHQIQSLYLDSSQRLYVAGSAAVCGGTTDFHFCDGQRGVIYISKKALP